MTRKAPSVARASSWVFLFISAALLAWKHHGIVQLGGAAIQCVRDGVKSPELLTLLMVLATVVASFACILLAFRLTGRLIRDLRPADREPHIGRMIHLSQRMPVYFLAPVVVVSVFGVFVFAKARREDSQTPFGPGGRRLGAPDAAAPIGNLPALSQTLKSDPVN